MLKKKNIEWNLWILMTYQIRSVFSLYEKPIEKKDTIKYLNVTIMKRFELRMVIRLLLV